MMVVINGGRKTWKKVVLFVSCGMLGILFKLRGHLHTRAYSDRVVVVMERHACWHTSSEKKKGAGQVPAEGRVWRRVGVWSVLGGLSTNAFLTLLIQTPRIASPDNNRSQ